MRSRLPFAAALALLVFVGRAYAVTQPPHDAPGGTQCVQCHIPYGGVNSSSQAVGIAMAGSSATSLLDVGKSWAVGAWTDGVITFTSGANKGSYRTITANTATSVTWKDAPSTPVANGDGYQLGKTTYDDIENKCRACHSATGTASNMANVGLHVVNGGATVIGCGKCHEPHNVDPNTGRGNGLLRLSIRWPTATATLAYPASPTNRFIATSPPYNGICQVCHTQTKHHRNDGTLADHFPTTDCTSCHRHQDRFLHGGGTGGGTNCGDCHGHDPGTPLGGGKVSLGAASFQSHSTHTENDTDDLRGPNVTCAECHDTSAFPYFNSGTDLNGDGKITLNETDVCELCHSSPGTYDGVYDAVIGAKANWQAGIYAADNVSLRPGKERWCATCHDEAPSYINGVSAPWVAGEESVTTEWGTTGYGFYRTGHGLPASEVYPWTLKSGSVQERSGAGLECGACHDSTLSHVDGITRTYATNRTPAGFQAGYRLQSANGIAPMQIPRVYQSADPTVKPEDFPLCFGCHNARPFTSANTPAATNFRNDPANRNAHNFHLSQQGLVFRSDWAADASASDSRPTCITCHNVHGSTQLAMINDGLLTSRGFTMRYANASGPVSGLPLADSTGTAWHERETQYSAANPSGLCAQNCHYNTDPNAWRTYSRLAYDPVVPQMMHACGAAGVGYVSVNFSKGVYGPTGAALTATDFVLADSAGRTITGVDHVAGSELAILSLSTFLGSGLGADSVAPTTSPAGYDHAGIYDALGNRVPQAAMTITERDFTPPTLTIVSPTAGATSVARTAPISFTLADDDSGVLWSSVSVTLSGSLGYAATFTSAQLTRTGSALSYGVSVVPTAYFGYGETLTVSVQATDAMGNPLAAPVWSFTTTAAPLPATTRLYPSGAGSTTDGWSVSPLNSWATSLRTNDGPATYAQGSVAATTFYLNLDDPPAFSGAVQSISITGTIQIATGTGTFPFTLGWRVGAAGASQSAAASVSSSEGWATKTVSVGGAGLTYADIVNLQTFVSRTTIGTHTDRVTQIYVDVTYVP